MARWRFAQDAREYVAHVRQIVSDASVSITARGPLDESLMWIEGFADRTDPLTPVRKEAARVAAAKKKSD